MEQERHSNEFRPAWWTAQHTIVWELAEPPLHDDFQRRADRYREHAKTQGPDDDVFLRDDVTPRNVDVDHAHLVPDENWEFGVEWEHIRPALRFGVGAREQYPNEPRWTSELEEKIRNDWNQVHDPSAWERMKHAVRRGFEFQNYKRV